MLKIRLQRVGRKHEPAFRLVLTDSKNSTKSGKSLETLGNYDSRRGDKAVLKTDRITYWLSQGAQASGTVHNLLVSKKIIEGKKINVLPLKKPIIKGAVEEVKTEDVKEEVSQEKVEVVEKETEKETAEEPVQAEETPIQTEGTSLEEPVA